VVDAGPWNINADEPPVLDYNLEFKTSNLQTVLYSPGPFRSADHDPLVVGLNPGRTIQGTSRTDALTGTIGNDTLVGAQGRDLLLGGAGADRFEFRSLLDLYDAIGDFQPGVDRLDIRALMAAVGAPTADPVAGGYLGTLALKPVQVSQSLSVGLAYTLVTFDPDGSAGPAAARPLVELIGVAVDDPAVLLGA
jgi:Ca2+-binding RTX toxin-like protein